MGSLGLSDLPLDLEMLILSFKLDMELWEQLPDEYKQCEEADYAEWLCELGVNYLFDFNFFGRVHHETYNIAQDIWETRLGIWGLPPTPLKHLPQHYELFIDGLFLP